MRLLDAHKGDPLNNRIEIRAVDGLGGACDEYIVRVPMDRQGITRNDAILFQSGPITTEGMNGLTSEALIAVLIDRLERFQEGPNACIENTAAIAALHNAMHWLKARTRVRASALAK